MVYAMRRFGIGFSIALEPSGFFFLLILGVLAVGGGLLWGIAMWKFILIPRLNRDRERLRNGESDRDLPQVKGRP